MAELTANYHSQIQQDTVNADTRNQATQNALEFVTRSLSWEKAALLATLMLEDYVAWALKASANGVAAGLNGHITELYKKLTQLHQKK